jgi:hypothetical protein
MYVVTEDSGWGSAGFEVAMLVSFQVPTRGRGDSAGVMGPDYGTAEIRVQGDISASSGLDANMGKLKREGFLIQLRETREEWWRRSRVQQASIAPAA